MRDAYGRDLDLNLLRVFLVVAELGSVTTAASQLYLTQPAVSAALRRLTDAVGAPLFVRQGRGLTLTSRGSRLLDVVRPTLTAMVEAALSPAVFDPATSERVVRIGLANDNEGWILPALLRVLATDAPRMQVISIPVQFRTVGEALASRRVDAAVTVADELPPSVRREPLFTGYFVVLHDPRASRIGKTLTEADYFARDHVIVSYNGDLRGVIEDTLHKTRRVRCSVSTFHHLGALVEGTPMLATVPAVVARSICKAHPRLRTAPLPLSLPGVPLEMLWSAADDDDPAGRFVRGVLVRVVREAVRE